MRLKLLLMVGGKTLLMQVLEQDGISHGVLVQNEDGAVIVSSTAPAIEGTVVYIRGESVSSNDDYAVCKYRSEKSAREAKAKILRCLSGFFNSGTVCAEASIFDFIKR